jgi:hypothetical protein
MKFSVSELDFDKSPTKGFRAENIISFPTAGVLDAGLWFYHSVNEAFYGWTGTQWQPFGSSSTVLHVEPSTTPLTPTEGDIYMDSTTHKLRCYDGTIWNDLF